MRKETKTTKIETAANAWSVRINGTAYGVIRQTGAGFLALPKKTGHKTYGVHPVHGTLAEATEYIAEWFQAEIR